MVTPTIQIERPPIPWSQLASRLARLSPWTSNAINPGLISFGDGWLHPSLIPHAALAACAAEAAPRPGCIDPGGPVLGLPALQQALIDTLRTNGVKTTPSEVLITGGAQQGLNVVARALISPGDAVVCESPTWYGAVRAFRAAGAEVVSVRWTTRESIPTRWRTRWSVCVPSSSI